MSTCDRFRDLFSLGADGQLDAGDRRRLDEHLAHCEPCRSLYEEFEVLFGGPGPLAELSPPDHLGAEIASSPCRRWLGLLFSAVDRELSEANVDRLFQHLESCPTCRRAWADLSLIHQVGDAIEPPQYLLARCLRPRRRRAGHVVLGRRTATAAAYMLAILASFVLGSPVSLARHDAAETVSRVSAAVGADLDDMARAGRGEARVMLWRALSLGRRAADVVTATWDRLTGEDADDRVPAQEPETEDPRQAPSRATGSHLQNTFPARRTMATTTLPPPHPRASDPPAKESRS
jgi:predicted anti-sigma-YlaC factor YlaD